MPCQGPYDPDPFDVAGTLGCRIAERRQGLALTQEALAGLVPCCRRSVQLWEEGRILPGIRVLPGLARALGVTVDWLLTGG